MNQKTTYELIITEKLQHLPLPDMEDAIWARVKKQLDTDLPTDDDGGSTPEAPSGSGGWFWGAGSLIFVAALVMIFLLKREPKQATSPANTIQSTTTATTTEQESNNRPFSPVPNRQSGSPPAVDSSPPDAIIEQNLTPVRDSAFSLPAVNLRLADTLQQTTFLAPPAPVQDTSAQKKRKRGVTGVTDADYRIVPSKKDSL